MNKNNKRKTEEAKQIAEKYSGISHKQQKTTYVYKNRKIKRLGKTCIHFNINKLTCNLFGRFCKNADDCSSYISNQQETDLPVITHPKTKHKPNEVGITAIVLSDNRKCANENHFINDVMAKIRIAPPEGGVQTYEIAAAYCKICDNYFVLKSDYKKAKEHGVILCPIIDRTSKYIERTKIKAPAGNESRIHQLGYNVKKGNGYTEEQRRSILANIIENTDISKYEIVSNITRCISQHQNQDHYSKSVANWISDLDFVNNYNPGDMPEVIISKLIIGSRK